MAKVGALHFFLVDDISFNPMSCIPSHHLWLNGMFLGLG
jgi:hypothetical protein